MINAVTYSRYSSNLQNETSIEDQQRICNQYAKNNDINISKEYSDLAITGDDSFRPEYQQLLSDAKNKKFDLILVDDLSRLTRGSEHNLLHEKFNYYGVRLVAVSDGIDSITEGAKLQISVKGLMNNMFLTDLKKRVHRGQTGKALKGFNAGGKSYGYDHVPIFDNTKTDLYGRPEIDHVEKVINEEHAAIVREIFQRVAEGATYSSIVRDLNARKIPTLRSGTWTTSTICGNSEHPHSGLLNNPIYIGKYYWNRTEQIRNPETGKKNKRLKDESEWILVEMPELIIISDDLWSKVKERQSSRKQKTKEKQSKTHKNARTGAAPKFLLSGILKCEECGGSMVVHRPGKFCCTNAYRRGPAICTNKNHIEIDKVETKFLSSIKKDLFTPAAIDIFKENISSIIKQRKKEYSPAIKRINNELTDVNKRIDNLMDILELRGELPDSVLEKIHTYENRKRTLSSQLDEQTDLVKDILPFLPNAVERYKKLVQEMPKSFSGSNMAPLREKVSHLLGGEVFLRKKPDFWVATYRGAYSGLLRVGASKSEISDATLKSEVLSVRSINYALRLTATKPNKPNISISELVVSGIEYVLHHQ